MRHRIAVTLCSLTVLALAPALGAPCWAAAAADAEVKVGLLVFAEAPEIKSLFSDALTKAFKAKYPHTPVVSSQAEADFAILIYVARHVESNANKNAHAIAIAYTSNMFPSVLEDLAKDLQKGGPAVQQPLKDLSGVARLLRDHGALMTVNVAMIDDPAPDKVKQAVERIVDGFGVRFLREQ